MRLNDYTTSTLVKNKQEFEYTAQMCALERFDMPDLAVQEYRLIKQEIERRELVYTSQATSSHLAEALNVVFTAIQCRSLPVLVDSLAQGVEVKEKSAEVRLNPKSGFFREILLRRQLDGKEDIVNAAIFIPGGAVPLAWLRAACPDLTVSIMHPQVYEVVRMAGDQTGRIEFVTDSTSSDLGALVTAIRVSY